MDLFAKSNDRMYLEKAYEIAYDNATILLQGQRDLNKAYLSEIEPAEAKEPDYRYMDEKQKKTHKRNTKKKKRE